MTIRAVDLSQLTVREMRHALDVEKDMPFAAPEVQREEFKRRIAEGLPHYEIGVRGAGVVPPDVPPKLTPHQVYEVAVGSRVVPSAPSPEPEETPQATLVRRDATKHCRGCGFKIAVTETYCGECLCEEDGV